MKPNPLFFCLALSAVASSLVACSGEDGTAGLPGETGTPGDKPADAPTPADPAAPQPSINFVEPRFGLVDSEVTIAISVDALALAEGAKVDFGGKGVTVKATKIISARTLEATLELAADASLGQRDVVLTQGESTLKATKAFSVAVPLDAKIGAGKAEQGSLVRLDLSNRDSRFFDTENFFLAALSAPGAGTLIQLGKLAFTATDGSVVMLGDPKATLGPLGFLGINNPQDRSSATFATASDAVTVSARTPEALTLNTAADQLKEHTLAADLASALFKVDIPAAPALVDFAIVKPDGTAVSPLMVLYGAKGTAEDLLAFKQEDPGFPSFGIPPSFAAAGFPSVAAATTFVTVADAGFTGSAAHKFKVSVTTAAATTKLETAASQQTGAASQSLGNLPGTAAATPGVIVSGELKAAGEEDSYRFISLPKTTPADMRLVVKSEVPLTILVDNTEDFSSDAAFQLDVTDAIGEGSTEGLTGGDGQTYFIKVMAADGAPTPKGKYTIGFRRLPPPAP